MSYKQLQPTKAIKATKKVKVPELNPFRDFMLNLFVENIIVEVHERLYAINAGFCPRKNVFEAFHSTTEITDALRIFRQNFGHSAEATWVEILNKQGRLIGNDIRISDIKGHFDEDDFGYIFSGDEFLNYSGKIDFVFHGENGEIILADSKNVSSLPDAPALNYVRQLQFYSAITGIDNAVLLYTTRQCGFISELEFSYFFVDTSQKALEQVLFTAFLSRLSINERLLPSIPEGFRKTTTCRYCKFNNLCWGEDKESIVYPLENILVEDEMRLEHLARIKAKEFYANRPKRKEQFLTFLGVNE